MNLARLRIFDEVVRTGTFAAAAESLSYTPSAVSQQMAKLEAELGTALLVRGARGLTLTDAGRALLERARVILAEVRLAGAEIDAIAGLRAGTLRLGSFPTATQTLVGRALATFGDRWPGVDVTLVDDEPHHNVVRLHDHELDLAVIFALDGRPVGRDYFGRELCPSDAVVLRPLLEDTFVLVVPDDHPLAFAPATVEALRDEVIIGNAGTPGLDELAVQCRLRGFEPSFNGFVCMDYGAVRALVAAGQGIGLVPGLAAARPLPGTTVRRLEDWAPRRQVMLARPANGVASAAADAMQTVLGELAVAVGGEPVPA